MARRKARERPGSHREIPTQPGRDRRYECPCCLRRRRECRSCRISRKMTATSTRKDVARYSYLSHLECARCGLVHEATVYNGLCTRCKSPLLARYDLEALASELNRDALRERPWELWRYHELLPSSSPSHQLTLGEVVTPLLEVERYGRSIGLQHLYVKDESATPTSTFKARGAAVGVSRIKELGIERIAMPTAGTPARRGPPTRARGRICVVDRHARHDAPTIVRAECLNAGARRVTLSPVLDQRRRRNRRRRGVRGARLVRRSTLEGAVPHRRQEDDGLRARRAARLGRCLTSSCTRPAVASASSVFIRPSPRCKPLDGSPGRCRGLSRCSPRAAHRSCRRSKPAALRVNSGQNPRRWRSASTCQRRSATSSFWTCCIELGGCAVGVSDDDLLDELRAVGAAEGLFMCPEGAATAVAVRRLVADGWIDRSERVVILNTGAGIKYPGMLDVDLPVMARNERLVPSDPAGSGAAR